MNWRTFRGSFVLASFEKFFHVINRYSEWYTTSLSQSHCIDANYFTVQIDQRSAWVTKLHLAWVTSLDLRQVNKLLLHSLVSICTLLTVIAASVWMYDISLPCILSSLLFLFVALTMPEVTVLVRVRGLPIAITNSPGRKSFEVPNWRVGNFVCKHKSIFINRQ